MKSFNVMGDCVSRDILELGGVKVSQYHAFSSPLSICSEKSEVIMTSDDLKDIIGKKYSNFVKRCMVSDFNKTVLDYVFEKKSDYFVLDVLDARHPLLVKGNHCITMTNRFEKIKHLVPAHIGLDEYKEMLPENDNMEHWKECIGIIAAKIRKHYAVDQIILNEHYGVMQYMAGSVIKNFSVSIIDNAKRYNILVKKLFDILRSELEGCHIIEFPDNVMATADHKWGLAELHYHDIYYDYGINAVKVILQDLSDKEEKEQLEQLRINCSEKFELLKLKKEIEMTKRNLEWFRNALNFAERHASDLYGDEKVLKWLMECKKKEKKIAVLSSACAAGRILLKGLKKYKINVIFSTDVSSFNSLSEDQFALCREADMVISANIHSNSLPQREEVKAVSVYEIFK